MATSSSAVATTSSTPAAMAWTRGCAVERGRECASTATTRQHREHRADPSREHRPELRTRRACCRSRRTRSRSPRRPRPRAAARCGGSRRRPGARRAPSRSARRRRWRARRRPARRWPGLSPVASPHTTGMTAPITAATGATSAGPADREALVEAAERGDVEHATERARARSRRRCGSPPAITATTTRAGERAELRGDEHRQRAGARRGEAAEEVTTSERRGDDQPEQERHRVPVRRRRGTVHAGARRVVGSCRGAAVPDRARVRRGARARRSPAARRTASSSAAGAAGTADYVDRILGAFNVDPPRDLGRWPVLGSLRGRRRFRRVPAAVADRGAGVAHAHRGFARHRRSGSGTGRCAAGRRSTATASPRSATILDLDAQPELRQLLFEHACEASYGAPEYGGNRDLTGWRAIGYAGDVQPRGWSDAEVTGA